MTDTETQRAPRASVVFPLILIVLLSAVQIIGASGPDRLLFELGNDSAMRLVTIRDLMAGQGWWDLNQYRLGLEGGFEMHWSRLVDAPMIATVRLFESVGLTGGGDYGLVVFWPLLWFGISVLCLWRIADMLAGPIAAFFAAVIGASMLISHNIYRPGSIDHHNIQIALLFVVMMGVVGRHNGGWWPIIAGVALSVGLGIGVETMPHLAIVAVAMALIWAFGGAQETRPLQGFSSAVLITMALVLWGVAPKSALQGGYCDAISVDLGVPIMLGCVVLFVSAMVLRSAGPAVRIGGLAIGGSVVLGVTLIAYPACLSNPLDTLDPYLHTHWLDFVAEAQGLTAILSGRAPRMFASFYVFGTISIGLSVYLAFTAKAFREAWLLFSALGLAALFFSAYQLRGVVLLAALGVVPVSVLAAQLRNRWQATGKLFYGLAALFLVLASVPTVWGMTFGFFEPDKSDTANMQTDDKKLVQDHLACIDANGMQALAALPKGVISANSNLGAQIMLHTQHRVLSAPYHRNEGGMRAQLEIAFSDTAEAAEQRLRGLGVSYVVSCTRDPELGSLHRAGYSGFGWKLQNGEVPGFLEPTPIAAPTDLKIYRVVD